MPQFGMGVRFVELTPAHESSRLEEVVAAG